MTDATPGDLEKVVTKLMREPEIVRRIQELGPEEAERRLEREPSDGEGTR